MEQLKDGEIKKAILAHTRLRHVVNVPLWVALAAANDKGAARGALEQRQRLLLAATQVQPRPAGLLNVLVGRILRASGEVIRRGRAYQDHVHRVNVQPQRTLELAALHRVLGDQRGEAVCGTG